MSYFPKQRKIGEIELQDEHFLLRFQAHDKPYVNQKYLNKILSYNLMIDESMYELYEMKRTVDTMMHTRDGKRYLWSYLHNEMGDAKRYYEDFQRLEQHVENLVIKRYKVAESFHTNALRFHRDQTVRDNKFEPETSSEVKDLVVLQGVAEAARQITNETVRTWDYFGLGRSDVPASFDNEDLFSTIGRYFIKTHGTLGAIGEVIRLLVVSPDDMATEDIAELCIADQQAGGTILLRAVLDKKIHHEANQHFLATSANIYLASRR